MTTLVNCIQFTVLTQVHTPSSLPPRDGRLHCDDEILSINGRSLSGMTQERAISLLRSVKGRVDLVVARVKDKTSSKVLVPSKASKVRWTPLYPEYIAMNGTYIDQFKLDGVSNMSDMSVSACIVLLTLLRLSF